MASASLVIDLDAVALNWRALDALTGEHCETAAVVKADAYGLGHVEVVERLLAEGVASFFVATAEEGAVLRRTTGKAAEIFAFSGHMPGDAERLAEHDAIPCLNAPEQIARHFADLPGHPFAVQLDTGMNRLGIEPGDWSALRSDLMDAGPRLVLSHLACADEPDHPMNAQQLRVFRDLTDGIAHRRSLSATGGILLGPEYHFELTRPGIGLYGGRPFAEAAMVVRLSVPVIQTRDVKPFETVGYGNTWTAKVETRVATISAGYADGILRAAGAGGLRVFAGETPCPVIGRVSMDLITVDVSELEDVPDTLDVLSEHQGIDDVADAAGTIGYEVLTSLGRRYSRIYEGRA